MALTRGYVGFVSPEDAEFVGRWSWSTLVLPDGKLRAVRRENGTATTFYMHREIIKPADDQVVDHRNALGIDNRRENLRNCSQGENVANQRPQRRTTSAKFKGVYHDKARGQWQAYINVNGTRHRLGRHKTPEDAARAYDAKASELHGAFALTNAALGLL